jgi:heme exporter protein D
MEPKQEYNHAKKVIIPWYDANILYYIVIIFTILAIGFSLVGISTALNNIKYLNYVWLPVTIIILCLFVLISTSVRITKRIVLRFKNRYLKEFNKDT